MNEMEIRRQDELEQLTPEQLGYDIRLLTSQARKIVLAYAVEIGHRLVLAKEKVGHGEWIDWVARETTLSQSGANRMMRLYEEYGSRQESLFGAEVNSSALTNLSVSNALQLLAFPPEEREQAAAELDAEHLSSRELAEAIAARKAAEQRALEAERALHELEEGEGLALAEMQEKLERAQEGMRDALKKAAQADEGVGPYKERAETAENAVAALREQIKELESRPIATVTVKDEEAAQEAARLARAKAEAEAAKKLKALQKKLEKAEKEAGAAKKKAEQAAEEARAAELDLKFKLEKAETNLRAAEAEAAKRDQDQDEAIDRATTELRAELEEARKKLKASDAKVAAFGIYFRAVQEDVNRMMEQLREIDETDKETARKLRLGVRTILSKTLERIPE